MRRTGEDGIVGVSPGRQPLREIFLPFYAYFSLARACTPHWAENAAITSYVGHFKTFAFLVGWSIRGNTGVWSGNRRNKCGRERLFSSFLAHGVSSRKMWRFGLSPLPCHTLEVIFFAPPFFSPPVFFPVFFGGAQAPPFSSKVRVLSRKYHGLYTFTQQSYGLLFDLILRLPGTFFLQNPCVFSSLSCCHRASPFATLSVCRRRGWPFP